MNKHSLKSLFLTMMTLLCVGVVTVWASDEITNTENTIFSANVVATGDVNFPTGTSEITNEQAVIVGGKISAISNQAEAKKLIGKQNGKYMFCMTNNDTYFKVELDNALAVGDVISAMTYTRTDTKLGLLLSTVESKPGNDCTTKLSKEATEAAAFEAFDNYTVTEDDGLAGATTFYIYRETGKSTYFNELKITRPSTPVEEPTADEVTALTVDMFYKWDGPSADANQLSPATVDFNIGNDVEIDGGGMVCGTSSVDYLTYADITGSSKLLIEGTPGMILRIQMNRLTDGGQLEERNPTIGEDGTAEVDLTDLEYVHINAIKNQWSWAGGIAGKINSIKFVKPSDALAIPKEALKKAISTAKLYNAVAKTEDSYATLQTAIANGEDALTAEDATAESLAAAKSAIEEAIAGLTLAEGYSDLTKEMFMKYASVEEPGEGEAANGAYSLFEASGLPYGDGNVGELLWADLTAYDKLIITTVGETKPRLCMNRLAAGGQQAATKEESKMLDINPNNEYTWSTEAYQTIDGNVYTIDLKKIVEDYTFARLHSIKAQGYGATVFVTGMYLYKATEEEPLTGAITALPYTTDFSTSIEPFDAGTIVTGTACGEVLNVSNTTATAKFAIGGTVAPYALGENEEVTVSFTGYHGWVGGNPTSKVAILNSEDVELISYTYSINGCKVTDVKLGGETVSGFEAFDGQAKYNNASSKNSANGYDGTTQHYVTTEGYSPIVTMKVSGSGAVSFGFVMSAKGVDKKFSTNLNGIKMDLAKIVITDNCPTQGRSICIDNLSITTEEKMLYKYTVNYVDENNNIIKTDEGSAEENTQVEVSNAPIWVDGVKYFVVSDNSEENKVSSDNNTVITVVCRTAASYAYTIMAVDAADDIIELATIAEDKNYEGETIRYPYPKYINVEGTLYEKGDTNKEYVGSFELDSDNKFVKVAYTVTDKANVIFFKEAEDIETLTAVNGGGVAARSSNAAGGYATEPAKIVTLVPGDYTLIAAGYGGNLVFTAGSEEILNMEAQGYWRDATKSFTLTDYTDITFVGGSGDNAALDYVIIMSENGGLDDGSDHRTHTWNFQNWSEATVANLKAEAAKGYTEGLWSDAEKADNSAVTKDLSPNNCFWQVGHSAAEGETLTANGEEIAELKGLLFTNDKDRSLAIAVNYGDCTSANGAGFGPYHGGSYLWLGSKNVNYFIIPAVKVGSTIKMGVESHNVTKARGVELYVEGEKIEGPATPKTYEEQEWTVTGTTDAVDVVVKNTDGCHIYFIDAEQDQEVLTGINAVKIETENGNIYNLQGQKVQKAQKGLYIING
ncbi:MAG: hypothetical protein K2G91_10300, partial [Prevotella sp.]|nr:hypothetical protein [Prevotella sp.]